ncbi:MAG: hypothetical protein AAGI91_17660, partial [Bacteroidota bacterium]
MPAVAPVSPDRARRYAEAVAMLAALVVEAVRGDRLARRIADDVLDRLGAMAEQLDAHSEERSTADVRAARESLDEAEAEGSGVTDAPPVDEEPAGGKPDDTAGDDTAGDDTAGDDTTAGDVPAGDVPAPRSEIELDAERALEEAEAYLAEATDDLESIERATREAAAEGRFSKRAAERATERQLRRYRGRVAEATEAVLAARQRRDRVVSELRATELTLFANGADALAAFDRTGLERGDVSEVLAYLGRAIYLSSKTVDGGRVVSRETWEDTRGATHLLYDPADATLYFVHDSRIRAERSVPEGVDPVAREAAEGLQTTFHGFLPGDRAFSVDWPEAAGADATRVEAAGQAVQVRYLSDKLHAAEAAAGGALPAGTVRVGRRGTDRGFKHWFTDTLPVFEIGEGEHPIVAVRGVLVT